MPITDKNKKAEADRRYYEKNREKLIENAKRWGRENKEKKHELSREWAKNNPEKMKIISQQNSRKRTENGKSLTYSRDNYITQRMLRCARSRAKQQNIPFDLTADDIIIPEFCPILGLKLEIASGKAEDNSPSLDKIIPSLGYVKGNICVISNRANRIKYNASLDELKKVVSFLETLV